MNEFSTPWRRLSIRGVALAETGIRAGGQKSIMDFHELKGMTVAQLRGVAKEAGITGSSQMRKGDLLKEVCDQLKIEMHEHHDVVGLDKASIKKRIKELKMQRDVAVASHNAQETKKVRRQIHRLKRKIHQATV